MTQSRNVTFGALSPEPMDKICNETSKASNVGEVMSPYVLKHNVAKGINSQKSW